MSLQLYFAPETCSRVPFIALEETKAEFHITTLAFLAGEHRSADFLAINPKGKVPALVTEEGPITENPVILSYLNKRFPEAKLLPATSSTYEQDQQLADLCFCSSSLHPLVSRIRLPHTVAGPEVAVAVWEHACAAMAQQLAPVCQRLATSTWWYGNQWSVVDAYLYWILWRIQGAQFDFSKFPELATFIANNEKRPSVQAMIKKEAVIKAELAARGLLFTPQPLIR
jgi:glutathione S-transferase